MSPAPEPSTASRRWQRILAVLGVCLPIPLLAATGLSIPLPAPVERIAAALVPWADAATLAANEALAPGARGSIVLLAGEGLAGRAQRPDATASARDERFSLNGGAPGGGGDAGGAQGGGGTGGGGGGGGKKSANDEGDGGEGEDPGNTDPGGGETPDDPTVVEEAVKEVEKTTNEVVETGNGLLEDVDGTVDETEATLDKTLAGLGG